jgi:hypothetical protein
MYFTVNAFMQLPVCKIDGLVGLVDLVDLSQNIRESKSSIFERKIANHHYENLSWI